MRWLPTILKLLILVLVVMWDPALMVSEYNDIAAVSVRCWQEGLPRAWYLLSGYRWVLRYLLAKYTPTTLTIGAHVARIEVVCSGLRFAAADSFDWYLCRSWR